MRNSNYDGFVGNTPVHLSGNSPAGGWGKNEKPRTRATAERKLADFIANALNRLDVDYLHITTCLSNYPSMIHINLFEMVLSFLNNWATMYTDELVTPGEKMYRMCQMSHLMVSALTEDTVSSGKHSASRRRSRLP